MVMMRLLTIVSVTLMATSAMAGPPGHAVMLRGTQAAAHVRMAERYLAAGNYEQAYRNANPSAYEFYDKELNQRAAMVAYVAKVRLRDQVWMRLAASFFATGLKYDSDNPVLAARLAEAYAFQKPLVRLGESPTDVAKRRALGLSLLEDLDRRHRVPDAFAYATLAYLRLVSGDRQGALAAAATSRNYTSGFSVDVATSYVDRR